MTPDSSRFLWARLHLQRGCDFAIWHSSWKTRQAITMHGWTTLSFICLSPWQKHLKNISSPMMMRWNKQLVQADYKFLQGKYTCWILYLRRMEIILRATFRIIFQFILVWFVLLLLKLLQLKNNRYYFLIDLKIYMSLKFVILEICNSSHLLNRKKY